MDLLNSMVEEFEKYENCFMSDFWEQEIDVIYNQQRACLLIIDSVICSEDYDNSLYFTALLYLHDDLLKQIDQINAIKASPRNEFVTHDLTIFKINNIDDQLPQASKSMIEIKQDFSESKQKKIKLTDSNMDNINRNKHLFNIIEDTLTSPYSKHGLNDIGGLEKQKKILREAIVFPIKFPQLFTGNRRKWNKALLYGPPGTGKTQLAHCLAAEVQAEFYNVSSADLLSRYIGESENLIKSLFEHCQNKTNICLVFMDEIDGLCRKRNSRETEFERRIKNELLNQLSSMDINPNNKIFFLACTNCPWDLDSAFIRRFQRRIYIPLPNRNSRLDILKLATRLNLPLDINWEEILDKTDGWSGSDLTDLVNCAMYQPLKDLENATNWIMTDDLKYMPSIQTTKTIERNIKDIPAQCITVRPIQISDFLTAFNEITKTVSNNNLDKFEDFNKSFGTLFNIS